jgi:hypothetical protein
MPWKETDAVKQRVKFLLEWEKRWEAVDGRTNFAALCRQFGISTQVGYDLVARFREAEHDVSVAAERSQRPHSSPTKVALEFEDFIVTANAASDVGTEEAAGVDSARSRARGRRASIRRRRGVGRRLRSSLSVGLLTEGRGGLRFTPSKGRMKDRRECQ